LVNVLSLKQLLKLTICIEFTHDIAAANKRAPDVKLWDRRPDREILVLSQFEIRSS